jgi:hypothetical protein
MKAMEERFPVQPVRQYVFLFLQPTGLYRITATVGSRNDWAALIAGHSPFLTGKSAA